MKRIKIWIITLFYHLMSWNCVKNSELLDATQTVEKILKEKKSLLRLGDGEFIIMSNGSIHYQVADDLLKEKLEKIIDDYINSPQKTKYIVCMPNQFLKCNGYFLSKKRLWVSSWAKSRYIFKRKYDKNVTYGDAFLFAKGNSGIYSDIWKEKKKAVFVHNNKEYAETFSKTYDIETAFIQVPERNAFQHYNELYNSIIAEIQDLGNTIVLVSAGPCAKVLVSELSENNILAIDTGHCWDSPLEIIKK